MSLLRMIESYLRRTEMAPTTFGRRAAHDPRFVYDMRAGRTVGDKLRGRVEQWMRENVA